MRTLIRDVLYFTNDEGSYELGYAIIQNGKFVHFHSGICESPLAEFDDVVWGKGMLLLPGFINTHGHAAMSLLRGYADDLPLQTWLSDYIWPAEETLTPDDIYVGSQLAMMEMLETGTTCFTDMYFHMEKVAEAVIESGMRAVLGSTLLGILPDSDELLHASVEFVKDFQGAGDGRIVATMAPHSPYTCSPEYLKKVIGQAHKLNVMYQIHLSETRSENKELKRQYGVSPTILLRNVGLFSQRVLVAHAIYLDDQDIDILADHNVHVAHNPGSNLKLGSGIAPVVSMMARQMSVGLGTDGASSNNKLDMYEEMRLVALLHKGALEYPTAISSYEALHMATAGGAKALFLPTGFGTLDIGAPADFQLIDVSGPRYQPASRLLSHVVYASHAGDVRRVFVAGKELYRNGEFLTIDAQRVIYEVNQVVRKFPQNKMHQ